MINLVLSFNTDVASLSFIYYFSTFLQLNDVYIPQLQSILTIPQSIGIIGGRPGSSLYFLGYQGNVMMYLDPHQVQPAACSDSDWMSFRCDVLKTMQIDSIDPSLALGFYCADQGRYKEVFYLLCIVVV